MISPHLEILAKEAFSDEIGFTLPPGPLRRVLQRNPHVQRLVVALCYEEVTGQEIRDFVEQLLRAYRPEQPFPHDLALAAVAVAVEHWNSPFAEEYLIDPARLHRREFSASFRVARECLKARYTLPRMEVRTVQYPHLSPNLIGAPRDRVVYSAGHPSFPLIGIEWSHYHEARHAAT